MVETVASERAIATRRAGGDVFEPATRNGVRDRGSVKVDQPRLGSDAVGIVARAASGLLVHDMEAMAPVEALRVAGTKTLVAEDAVPIVAFVTKGVIAESFRA